LAVVAGMKKQKDHAEPNDRAEPTKSNTKKKGPLTFVSSLKVRSLFWALR